MTTNANKMKHHALEDAEAWKAVHSHEYGETFYYFLFVPNKDNPYFDANRVVEMLEIDLELNKGETFGTAKMDSDDFPFGMALEDAIDNAYKYRTENGSWPNWVTFADEVGIEEDGWQNAI